MKIHRIMSTGVLGLALMGGTAFAQNIQTDTTSTTVGSTQFGFIVNSTNLETMMQVAAGTMTCDGGSPSNVCTPVVGNGFNNSFVRLDQMPGSFTDSAFGDVSSEPNFACGATGLGGNDCGTLYVTSIGTGTGGPQTAPDFSLGNQLTGAISMNVDLGGAGTAGMPEGFMRFTMDPASNDTTIDQLIDHTVSLGGGSDMVFRQRDATIGYNNLFTDDQMVLATAILPANDVTLVPFTSIEDATTSPTETFMVSRLLLSQGNADGFGALDLDVTVNFPAGTLAAAEWPVPGQYSTPGLNTGIGGNGFGFP